MAIKYDDALLVYTSDARGFRENEVQPLFERLLRGNRPLVLFVHGRGEEPNKSLAGGGGFVEGKAVGKLEAYGCTTVMFSWDSERGRGLRDRERPLGNMNAAADRLGKVLRALQAALAAAPAARPKLTFLAHSMGTIVVQRFVERNNGWFAAPLFTNVILSSADADNLGHPAWVDRIGAVERVLITVNPKDDVLRKSKEARQPNAVALGRDHGTALASNATYALISVDAHEVFTKRDNHPEISSFFAASFEGRNIPLGEALPAPGRRFRLRR